jgi:hypothetical protein
MKTKKNKLINLLKNAVLFFSISLLLWNCEKEDFSLNDQPNTEINNGKSWFNKNHSSSLEKNNYYLESLDWNKISTLNDIYYIPFKNSSIFFEFKDKKNKVIKTRKITPYIIL